MIAITLLIIAISNKESNEHKIYVNNEWINDLFLNRTMQPDIQSRDTATARGILNNAFVSTMPKQYLVHFLY